MGIPTADSNTSHEMVSGKSNTYQRSLLIVVSSLFALFVWIAVTSGKSSYSFKSSAQEINVGVGALADNRLDTANLALSKDIFGVIDVSEIDEGSSPCCSCNHGCPLDCSY